MSFSINVFCQNTIDLEKLAFSLKDTKPSIANYILKEKGLVLVTEANVDSINEENDTNIDVDLPRGTSYVNKLWFVNSGVSFDVVLSYYEDGSNVAQIIFNESFPSASEIYQKFIRKMKSRAESTLPPNKWHQDGGFKIGNISVWNEARISTKTGRTVYCITLE
jgi:hypothetical protein